MDKLVGEVQLSQAARSRREPRGDCSKSGCLPSLVIVEGTMILSIR